MSSQTPSGIPFAVYAAVRQLYLTEYDPNYPHRLVERLRQICGLYHYPSSFTEHVLAMQQRPWGDPLWIPKPKEGIKLPKEWTYDEIETLRKLEVDRFGTLEGYEKNTLTLREALPSRHWQVEDILLENECIRLPVLRANATNFGAWSPDMKKALRDTYKLLPAVPLADIVHRMERLFPMSDIKFDIPSLYAAIQAMSANGEM